MTNLIDRVGFPKSYRWLILLLILALYAMLIVPTVGRLGIGWDEATDLRISRAYLSREGLFFGLARDLSQTRLPMFVVALVFQVLGTSDLLLARYTTVIVGGLSLVGVYILGKDCFDRRTGLLAAALLAINPFFLAFARLSFTESDVYLACTLTWLLVFLSRLQVRPTLGNALWSGLFLGLSISAKATILIILPVIFLSFLSHHLNPDTTPSTGTSQKAVPVSKRSIWFWTGVAAVAFLIGVLASRLLNNGGQPLSFHLLNYAWVWLAWFITLFWAWRSRNHAAHLLTLFAFVTAVGLLTFVIFPPDHLTNSGIIEKLITRAGSEMGFSVSFVLELAALHLSILILKSTPVLGWGLLTGFLVSLSQWRRRELPLLLLVAGTYLVGLFFLPLAQTFYTIPILPILSLLAADQFLRLYAKRRALTLAILILVLTGWGVDMKQSYPDYHLNGYQWLGARSFLGRSSIGYRSIVYVPSDGVQQVMEWLNENAKAGQVAQLYIEPWHIVDSIAYDPAYTLVDGLQTSLDKRPDFIVLHINTFIQQGEGSKTPGMDIFRYPFDLSILDREYEQVFVVRRAFDLEMASIWKRK